MELYPRFDRLHSQIRQTWRYKVTVACTYTMLQMHVSSLGGTNTQTIMVRTRMYKHADNHGKDTRALEHDHSISNRFSEWRRQLMQTCGMPFTSDAYRCDLGGSDCKSYGTNKDRHVFSRTSSMKNSSTILNVISVPALPGLALCSRCNARIHALNKRIGANSSSTRTDSSLPGGSGPHGLYTPVPCLY